TSARAEAEKLLNERVNEFSAQAISRANALVKKQARAIAALCSERIVERDIMPALEAAQKDGATAAELEGKFSENIRNDIDLRKIVEARSDTLRKEIEQELNHEFRRWLKTNGVPLAPKFDFPAHSIGQDFLKEINIRVSRLYELNLMGFTLQNILPIIAGTATAGVIIHAGEPVSAAVGGGAAFGATWLMARVAPKFLENRRIPPFLLNESNRKKIIEKNRAHIEAVLEKSFAEFQRQLASDIERRFHETLSAMLASLTALNQVKVG
ncbi:MAG: molecular chaperone, partial [Desulfovibrio sp.]|nr:molecular chaperone [Desulfovibrio sp.]